MYLNSWILGLSDGFFSLYLEESMGILVSMYAKKWKILNSIQQIFLCTSKGTLVGTHCKMVYSCL